MSTQTNILRNAPVLKSTRTRGSKAIFRRSGAAVLELALTLSILFSVTFGTVEYGYYFFVKNTMEGAAREGCRAGIVAGATTSNCNSAILNQLQVANLVPSGTTVGGSGPYTIGNYTVTYFNGASTVTDISTIPVGNTLTAQITATWGVVGASFRPMALIGSGKQLLVASAMRKEGQ